MEVEDDGLVPIDTVRRTFPWLVGACVGMWIGGCMHADFIRDITDRVDQIEKRLNETAQHSTSNAPNKP